uniref:ATP-dependent RNA helicase n=1 Tax=Anolis carolinensis TaxID=28377 RepID=A0A803U0Y2_ANOCA
MPGNVEYSEGGGARLVEDSALSSESSTFPVVAQLERRHKRSLAASSRLLFCRRCLSPSLSHSLTHPPSLTHWAERHSFFPSRMFLPIFQINANEIVRFSDFPLSKKTLKGLQEAQYRMVTEIQRQTIGLALLGKDVLGAAKTGSGKTLAFIVPALEILYRQQWTSTDGLGVLIISPTRELAYQTFEVLRKVGKNHDFSAGLVIGGKDLKQEADRIHNINILICTPGRLLQHMDETSYFYASDLQMLILDEADRILDMGFADTMNAIIENLPKKRQTLLFSATQTKSVKDLARLSLKDPEYVWVHEKAKFSTPATLEQNYIVCELHQKISMLYSFLRSHLNKKSIVFFASCKEVQYLFRVFCRLRPGLPILALHGKQQQMKRMEVYTDFVRKKSAVLFATDLAARGLDFPAVNWVIQFDCPEDANTYIHRVGRTARYKEGGEALLVLIKSEENGMIQQLSQKKVPINKIKINPEKLVDIQKKLQSFLAQDQELKERAQRCFVSYLRSVYLMKNKEVFDVFKLPIAEYALSLGLAVAPRVRFLQKVQNKMLENEPKKEGSLQRTEQPEEGAHFSVSNEDVEKCRALFTETAVSRGEEIKELSGRNGETEDDASVGTSEIEEEPAVVKGSKAECLKFFEEDEDEDEDDDTKNLDVLTVKRRNIFGTEPDTLIQQWPPAQKTVQEKEDKDDSDGINLDKAKERLHEEDKFDKEEYRKKIKEKHRVSEVEEENVAFLDHSESDGEFDPSTLPDPDRHRDSDQEADLETHSELGMDKQPLGKRLSATKGEPKRKKMKFSLKDSSEPLDTGLSLAEDEALVLHLLNSQS